MIKSKQVSIKNLEQFGSVTNLNEQAKSLVDHQKAEWDLARINFDALHSIQTRTFDFGHFKIITQYNPERIRSSAAKTDAVSISERPCFLCLNHLPKQQSGIVFQDKYLVLANPYPIFPVHLTISHKEHTLQEIQKYFPDMLELSRELSDFTVFYNGPGTGASAPDHFHFQAIIKDSLPVENEFGNLDNYFSEVLFHNDITKVIAVEDYLRCFVSIISESKKEAKNIFKLILNSLEKNGEYEPMLNVLCRYEKEMWRVIIFLREKQRPSHFYLENEKQIITSPASVEMGGILVLPREEDFKKITKAEIRNIYEEVSLNTVEFNRLTKTIKDLISRFVS